MYTVQDLLQKSFSLRSPEEKLDIVNKGRPTPPLPNLVQQYKTKTEQYVRHFSLSQYENVDWLTGCEISSRLFCWPCLLFSNKTNDVWSKHGFVDLNHLSSAQQKHSKSQTHVQCFLKSKLFGKQKIDTTLNNQHGIDTSKHNEEIKKNRALLIRVIDAICVLVNQELPLWGHDESHSSMNKGHFLEFLNLLKKYDPFLETHLNFSKVFQGNFPVIQTLIRAINEVVKEEIKNEMKSVSFVAIILDEMSDIENKSQLSTVLRYIKDNVIYERFLGFADISAKRTVDGLFTHIEQVVNEFGISTKLVCHSCDGASIMSDQLSDLQSKVLSAYPHAIFAHCYAHVLNLVLQQSVSVIKECRLFFKTLGELSAFFPESSNRTYALQEFMQRNLPTVGPIGLNFASGIWHTVKEYRSELCEFFENIIKYSNVWDTDTVIKSCGFLAFLQEFETIFLLEVFSMLFTYTDILYTFLQIKEFDILYCSSLVNDIKDKLQHDKEHSYSTVWKNTISIVDETYEMKSKRHCPDNSEQENNYCLLYVEIIDCLLHQIDSRFSQLEKLEYFHLLHHQKYSVYKKSFPEPLLQKLLAQYENMFDQGGLKNELNVLYTSAEFNGKGVHELVNFMHENDLSSGFCEVYKLASLMLTIPCTTNSVEHSFSKVKKIRTYLRSTQTQERLSNLSLLSIEKELVHKMKDKDTFHNAVIEKFASQERRIQLLFK